MKNLVWLGAVTGVLLSLLPVVARSADAPGATVIGPWNSKSYRPPSDEVPAPSAAAPADTLSPSDESGTEAVESTSRPAPAESGGSVAEDDPLGGIGDL